MPVEQIIYGGLKIDLKKFPEWQKALTPLDSNGNGVVELADAVPSNKNAYSSSVNWNDSFLQTLGNALLKEKLITPLQKQGMITLFSNYDRMAAINEITTDWSKHHTDTWGTEMEFPSDYYQKMVAGNVVSVCGDGDLYFSSAIAIKQLESVKLSCGCGYSSFEYDTVKMPSPLKDSADRFATMMKGIRETIRGYREVEEESLGGAERDCYYSPWHVTKNSSYKNDGVFCGSCPRP